MAPSSSRANSVYETGLDKCDVNFAPLTPLSFLERSAYVYPERISVLYKEKRYTWQDTWRRCCQMASALKRRGIGAGDTVAVVAPNVPAAYEVHFGVPMAGAVLNAVNIRLDAPTVAHILAHSGARMVIVDHQFAVLARDALAILAAAAAGEGAADSRGANSNGGHADGARRSPPPSVVWVDDAKEEDEPEGCRLVAAALGGLEYEAFLREGCERDRWQLPADEWDAISLNYTSGTTSSPKVTARSIFEMVAEHRVTNFCGAPVVLNFIVNALPHERRPLPGGRDEGKVHVMTAGAAPPPTVLAGMEELGFRVTHTYGLTETYGPAVMCEWKGNQWDALPLPERARLNSRQGVKYVALEGLDVMDPESMEPVPPDGATMGEVVMRGNMVMKGYMRNPAATRDAFQGGWFRSGDVAVKHPDGYIELKDRSKDIIISGGENISSIQVEAALYRHPSVLEAAVVAHPDDKWGETVCAFVTLKAGHEHVTDGDIVRFCREHLPRFMVPRTVVFAPLPKTATGKVQKFVLRKRAQELAAKAAEGSSDDSRAKKIASKL
eukprot:jgi/Mesen1/1020/ME000121S00087